MLPKQERFNNWRGNKAAKEQLYMDAALLIEQQLDKASINKIKDFVANNPDLNQFDFELLALSSFLHGMFAVERILDCTNEHSALLHQLHAILSGSYSDPRSKIKEIPQLMGLITRVISLKFADDAHQIELRDLSLALYTTLALLQKALAQPPWYVRLVLAVDDLKKQIGILLAQDLWPPEPYQELEVEFLSQGSVEGQELEDYIRKKYLSNWTETAEPIAALLTTIQECNNCIRTLLETKINITNLNEKFKKLNQLQSALHQWDLSKTKLSDFIEVNKADYDVLLGLGLDDNPNRKNFFAHVEQLTATPTNFWRDTYKALASEKMQRALASYITPIPKSQEKELLALWIADALRILDERIQELRVLPQCIQDFTDEEAFQSCFEFSCDAQLNTILEGNKVLEEFLLNAQNVFGYLRKRKEIIDDLGASDIYLTDFIATHETKWLKICFWIANHCHDSTLKILEHFSFFTRTLSVATLVNEAKNAKAQLAQYIKEYQQDVAEQIKFLNSDDPVNYQRIKKRLAQELANELELHPSERDASMFFTVREIIDKVNAECIAPSNKVFIRRHSLFSSKESMPSTLSELDSDIDGSVFEM